MSRTPNQAFPNPPTYIGIAFLASADFPMQVAIVLSHHETFNTIRSCGTVIETVNGWVESWRPNSPTAIEPYLTLMGILLVGVVHRPASEISNSIHSLGWKAQDVRLNSNSLMYGYSNDYVRRAILHLCQKRTINLALDQSNIDEFITNSLGQIREQHASNPRAHHVVSAVAGIFGQTNF